MGCGGSTAKPTADEPMAAVMPSGTASGRASGRAAGKDLSATPSSASAAATPAAAPTKKKALVIYDPLHAPFPPSAASLSRKVVGRAPLFKLDFTPEWRRAGEVVQALAVQRKQLMKAVAGMNASVAAAAAATTATANAESADGEEKRDAGADSDATAAAPAAAAAVDADSVPAPAVFSSSTHEDNVVSGALGDAHVLAALVSVAAHPNRLARLFPSLDDPALAAVADQPAPGKNTHIAGLIVGSKLKSSALAKVYLSDSSARFAEEMRANKYAVRLFYGGLWQIFTVDDCIPCTVPATTTEDGSPVASGPLAPLPTPLFTHCRDSSEIWMILVEKALAKAAGSYEDLCHATPVQLFRMLTGGSAETMVLPLPDKIGAAPTEDRLAESKRLWSQIMTCWNRADMISASTRELTERQHAAVASDRAIKATRAATSHSPDESPMHHFLHDHAELGIRSFFSVLDVVELPASVGGARLMLLRNPQGSQHYDGRWSEGSAEWKALEDAQPDGALHATRLRLSRKKHSAKTGHTHTASSLTGSAGASSASAGGGAAQDSGIFWMEWSDVLLHFAALFTCAVLPDQFDCCQTVQGEWKGKSAAGKPAELDVPASSGSSASSSSAANAGLYNDFLRNPQFRIRNTGTKKSTGVVITLSRGSGMCNALTSSLSAVNNSASAASAKGPLPSSVAPSFFGFKIVSNQLNHTLNTNAPTSSPIFGQIQLSPLHDDLICSPLSQDNSVSVSLPGGLAFGRDFYLVPFQFEAAGPVGSSGAGIAGPGTGQGLDGDFVVNLWTNSQTILFDSVAPLPNNPQIFPVVFSRRDQNCGGNLWADSYLTNPTFRITSSAPPDVAVKLLCVLNKTRKADADVNVNMRLLVNTAPSTINTSAMGCVSAPAKPGGAAGKRGSVIAPSGSAAASAIAASSSEEKHEEASASPALHAAPKKSTYGKLAPVVGSLSPFHEGVEGACTRTGESNFYSADRSYAMVAGPIQPGREYFLVASTFMPHTEMEASLSLWGGAALEHVKVERTGREFHRQLEGRWVGTSAAGPARRKKTWLNNPQFCVRHHAPTPISIVITLTYTGPLGSGGSGGGGGSLALGAPGSEASINISFCTFPSGSADPNPLTAAEKESEKRKQKEEGKRTAAVEEAKKKKLETERKASLQAQDRLVRGGDAPAASSSGAAAGASASAAGGGLGVASLRIKSKTGPGGGKSGSKKDRNNVAAPNMFGNLDDDAADDPAAAASASSAGSPADSLPRVSPLTTDFELISQTTFNGDLYRSGRCFHLFVPEVAPERSYFIVPSTAVPGMEGEFAIQVFGASSQAELRLDPCWLNTSTEAAAMDMTALASRRMSAAVIASTTSHKAKKLVPGETKKASAKKKH